MTSASRGVTTVTGNNAGRPPLRPPRPGYATANGEVLVTWGGTAAIDDELLAGSLTLDGAATQNLR